MNPGDRDAAPLSLKDLLAEYAALARRGAHHWRRGAVVFVAVLAAGLAWVVTRPRVYRSEARFQVQDVERRDGDAPGAEEVQRSIENRLAQVYGSRTHVLSVVGRQRLYPSLRGRASDARLAQTFWDSLDRRVETDVVQVGFRYGDPDGARRTVASLVDLFVNARRDAALARARETLHGVEAQVRQVESSLAERQRAFDAFARLNPDVLEEIRARQTGQVHVELGTRRARPAEAGSPRTAGLQARVTQLEARLAALRDPAPVAAEEPDELRAMRERVRAKQSEVQAMRQRYLPEHPTRAAAERELRDEAARLDAAESRHRAAQQDAARLSRAERELRVASVERELQAARAELSASRRGEGPAAPPEGSRADRLVAAEAEYNRLQTDVSTTRLAYQELLRRQLERAADVRRVELSGGESIRVLDAPSLPVEPEPPGRTKLATVVALLATLLALGVSLGSGLVDPRVHDLADLRRWGGLDELPFIPDLHTDEPHPRRS